MKETDSYYRKYPEYAVVGKPIDFMFKIIDENFKKKLR